MSRLQVQFKCLFFSCTILCFCSQFPWSIILWHCEKDGEQDFDTEGSFVIISCSWPKSEWFDYLEFEEIFSFLCGALIDCSWTVWWVGKWQFIFRADWSVFDEESKFVCFLLSRLSWYSRFWSIWNASFRYVRSCN